MTLSLLDAGLDDAHIELILEVELGLGRLVKHIRGMCGSLFLIDQGERVSPRLVAAKIPRVPENNPKERNQRFARELLLQHRTYWHPFVNWPFDYRWVHGTPVALFRGWDGDLSDWIPDPTFTTSERLAFLIYLCSGLRHCQNRGITCHQDLKPQNILVRVPQVIYSEGAPRAVWPVIADFGLANMAEDFGLRAGAKPYMAPEQWGEGNIGHATDVFALGVIIFEVLSDGWHPIGELTRDWWPVPQPGRSKKWQREQLWRRWIADGTPIVEKTLRAPELRDVVRRCLSSTGSNRPTLDVIQIALLEALKARDEQAYLQGDFQAVHWHMEAQRPQDWEYRQQAYRRFCDELLAGA